MGTENGRGGWRWQIGTLGVKLLSSSKCKAGGNDRDKNQVGASGNSVVARNAWGGAACEGPEPDLLKVHAKGSSTVEGQFGEAQGASCCHSNMHSLSLSPPPQLPLRLTSICQRFPVRAWVSRERPGHGKAHPEPPEPGGHGHR